MFYPTGSAPGVQNAAGSGRSCDVHDGPVMRGIMYCLVPQTPALFLQGRAAACLAGTRTNNTFTCMPEGCWLVACRVHEHRPSDTRKLPRSFLNSFRFPVAFHLPCANGDKGGQAAPDFFGGRAVLRAIRGTACRYRQGGARRRWLSPRFVKKSQRKVHVVRLTLTMFVGEAGEVLFPLQLALAVDESG